MDITKLYQMFILGTGNLSKPLLNGLGGVIFFTRDIHSKEQFKELIQNISAKATIPLFLSIDQEGGKVERTENIHPRYLSPMRAFERGEDFLRVQTKEIAHELNNYGVNMNFAPCLDVNSNPDNPIIGERAFSNLPEQVCIGYDIVSNIYRNNNIIPVIKHFPGHGDASKDSHLELPKIQLSLTEMENVHIKPFAYAINNGVEAVMVAHLHCTCFDANEIPTSLSNNCIHYLRNTLNFNGVIISDDMFMKGVDKYGKKEACIKGIKSGLNMFIYRESSNEVLNMIDDIYIEAQKDEELQYFINDSYERIIRLKEKFGIISK